MGNKAKKVFSLSEFKKQFSNSKQNFDHKNPVVVSMNMTALFETQEVPVELNVTNHKEGIAKVVAKAYHDQANLNGSKIDPEVFIENSESLKNRPILANIIESEDGIFDFGAHDFTVECDEEGNLKIDYQEVPIGVIQDYHFEYDTEAEVNRAVVEGYIFSDYNNAMDIINRRGSVDCSVELFIRDFHFDEESEELYLDDYYVSGLTLLGAEHTPGMAGSNVTAYEETDPKKLGAVTEDDQDGVAPSNKEEGEEEPQPDPQPQPAKAKAAPAKEEKPAAEPQSEETSESEEPEAVMEGEDLSEEQKEELNVQDNTDSEDEDGVFILQSQLDEANKLLEERNDQITKLEESINSLNEQLNSLADELARYRDAEEEAAKDAVLEDELYSEYLETEEFKEIIESRSELSAAQFEARFALAFAQMKRSENQKQVLESKKFFSASKKPVSQLEQKYGKLFANKRKEKN